MIWWTLLNLEVFSENNFFKYSGYFKVFEPCFKKYPDSRDVEKLNETHMIHHRSGSESYQGFGFEIELKGTSIVKPSHTVRLREHTTHRSLSLESWL